MRLSTIRIKQSEHREAKNFLTNLKPTVKKLLSTVWKIVYLIDHSPANPAICPLYSSVMFFQAL